jgi:hypothetical protein
VPNSAAPEIQEECVQTNSAAQKVQWLLAGQRAFILSTVLFTALLTEGKRDFIG